MAMYMSQSPYLTLASDFLLTLLGLLVLASVVVVMLRMCGLVLNAFASLGLSWQATIMLLLCSLAGSYFNIPVASAPSQHVTSGHVVELFGMQYAAPNAPWPGTIIAINVGGALIPTMMSLYLLITRKLWLKGAAAIAALTLVTHWLADPVAGVGIIVPVFLPAAAAVIVAVLLSRRDAAPLAYMAGSVGSLIGADLTNLNKAHSLSTTMISIGGAGTFDGIFLTGLLALAVAGVSRLPQAAAAR